MAETCWVVVESVDDNGESAVVVDADVVFSWDVVSTGIFVVSLGVVSVVVISESVTVFEDVDFSVVEFVVKVVD